MEATVGYKLTFINIHVRKADYINFLADHFKGRTVDEKFFLYCIIEEFLRDYPNSIFLVASDDVKWCKEQGCVSRADK